MRIVLRTEVAYDLEGNHIICHGYIPEMISKTNGHVFTIISRRCVARHQSTDV
jgi:hypothetical protein